MSDERYSAEWKHCTIHLNPETGIMHSDGDHDVRYWIENKIKSLSTEVSELTEQIRQKDAQAKGFVQLYDVVSTYRIAPVVVDDPNVMAWCDQIEDALEMIEYPDGIETADGGMGLADAVAQFRMDRNIESEKILLDLTEKLLWYADEKGGIFAPQIRSLVKDASTDSGSRKPCDHLWHIQTPAPHLMDACPKCGEALTDSGSPSPPRCIFCRDVDEPMPDWNGKCPRCSQQIWPAEFVDGRESS